jgi:DNA-binding LacI/PurR family transcriptional regulator
LSTKRVTVYDIAERVGVSHTTVSLALRNHPDVTQKRREEVRRVAKEMGYVPDPHLAALAAYRRGNRPLAIQSAIAWFNHWDQPGRLRKQREFDAYWHGAQEAAKRFGYQLEEICWSANITARRFEQILLTRNIRGVLIPPHATPPDWGDFDWNKFSVIRFGLSVPHPDSHLVTADQLRGVLMAVKRISDYGYARIGLIVSEDYDRKLGGSFIGGYRSAQQFFNLPVLPPLLTDQEIYQKNGDRAKKALKSWMEKTKPDAVLTVEAQIPALLGELNYRIPEDVAVAGSSWDVPVDAGIDQHSIAIGRTALEMLVAQINLNERGEPADPCRILVESRWRDGASLPPRR